MTAAELVQRLVGVTRTSTGWSARCPAHDDRKASLSVTEGQDGRILLHCHAGCSTETIVTALGLTIAHLFPARPKAPHNCKPGIVTTYDYTDESGNRLFQCVRFDPKTFKQRRPDPHKPDEWIWNVGGVRRVLYRLPEVLNAKERSETIFICEGEKDCDAMAKAGFVATCNPMGAGKWLPEHTETLRGTSSVVVITDKDDAGRKHALVVATALRSVAGSVKVVEFPDRNGHRVKDAADFLAAGGTAAELRTIAEAAPEFTVSIEPPRHKAGSVASEYLGVDETASAVDEEITRLAALSPLEYERQRETAASKLDCRTSVLDKLVDARRPKSESAHTKLQGRTLNLPDVERWPDPVNGADVLSEVAETFSRYAALPDGAADALALWVAHAHCCEAFVCTPRLHVTSPEKGCGKSTLRDVLATLVPRPMPTENLSAAVLFRITQSNQPTLLADECDRYLRDNDELLAMLNAGHRRGGQALRCEGDNHEVRAFNVFAPAVLCGIGALPGTLHDRSIIVRLERARPGELRERFDSRRVEHETYLCRKLARFAADHRAALEHCDPTLPPGAFNRVADNWRPLFAIAEIAGGDWPRRAGDGFKKLTSREDGDAQGVGTALLGDIADVFAATGADKLPSAEIVDSLAKIEGREWAEWGRARKPISTNQLAKLLHRFSVLPRTIKLPNGSTAKGYHRELFNEAFARYLPQSPFPNRNPVTMPENIGDSAISETSPRETRLRIENAISPNKDGAGYGVTFQNPRPGANEAEEMLL